MARRSASNATKADRHYPVRVRVAVPECGFGQQLNVMLGWLNIVAGRGNFWVGSEAGPGLADAALFYFNDVETARAFVNRFACGIVLLRGCDGAGPV